MSISLAIQYWIVGLVVLACVVLAFRKLLPKLSNRWLAAASIHFARKRDSRIAQWLSRRLQPRQATGNCADGCATCNACGPKKPLQAERGSDHPQAVKLRHMPLPKRDAGHGP